MKQLLCSIVILAGTSAFAQHLDSLVETEQDAVPNCQQYQTGSVAPLTASCTNQTWSDAYGDSGVATATGTANYGLLQGYMNASETIEVQAHSTNAETNNTEFYDVVYFPGLKTNANLQATLKLSGTASGDLAPSSAGAGVTLTGDGGLVAQCGVTNSAPMSSSFNGTCVISVAVTPSDGVSGIPVAAMLSLVANAIGPNFGAGLGSDSVTITYNGKGQGASVALVLVGVNGKPINGVKITSASGTKYPTR